MYQMRYNKTSLVIMNIFTQFQMISSEHFTEAISRPVHIKVITITMHPYLHVTNMFTSTTDIPTHTKCKCRHALFRLMVGQGLIKIFYTATPYKIHQRILLHKHHL